MPAYGSRASRDADADVAHRAREGAGAMFPRAPRRAALLVLLSLSLGLTRAEDAPADPLAATLERMRSSLGGQGVFDAIPMLSFQFSVEVGGKVGSTRTSVWDKVHDRVRTDVETKEGVVRCAFSRHQKRFEVRQGDEKVEGKDAEAIYELQRKAFRSDRIRLMLPFLLGERGFRIALDGEQEHEGAALDRLAITFGDELPDLKGDRYWLLLERETGRPVALLEKWKTMKDDQAPLRFDFADVRDVGGVRLPTRLKGVGNGQTLRFDAVEALPPDTDVDFLGV